MSQQSLEGKNAVVTGSSRGIGRAVAIELAAAGANVLVHARQDKDAASDVSSRIAALGGNTAVVLYDLVCSSAQDSLVRDAWDWSEGIDIWVNNAGADVLTGTGAANSFEQKLQRLWEIDVLATIRLSRSIGIRMKSRGHGVIVNIGWDQASHGMAGDSGEMFAATKGAVMSFSQSLAQSLAPDVRVNCVAPGWIKTAWGDQASDYWQRRAQDESLRARWGTPQDVARAVRFVASSDADYVNGQVICVNGGFRYGSSSVD